MHIFVNSVDFIKRVVKSLTTNNYRVVCSEKASNKNKTINVQSINSDIKKINFYTSTAFEGCDIYDENGYSIIVSDSNLATTVLDISTLVIQICGRLRDSKYKDSVLMLLNVGKHRYCGKQRLDFENRVKENDLLGKETEKLFIEGNDIYKRKELRSFNDANFNSFYVIKEDDELKYDSNLKTMDEENFNIINSIYNTTINVLKEINNTKSLKVSTITKVKLEGINKEIYELLKSYQTFDETKELLTPIFEKYKIKINQKNIGSYLKGITTKKRRTIDKKVQTIYYKK